MVAQLSRKNSQSQKPASSFVKRAVRAGVYKQTSIDPVSGDMVTQTIYVSPQFLQKAAWSTMQMMRRALDVPVCLDHQEHAKPSRKKVDEWLADEMRSSVGKLEEVKYDPLSQELEYRFSVNDPIIAEKIRNGTITKVSPNFHSEFSPGTGEHFRNVIAHLALTFRPRDHHQSSEPMREVRAVRASAPDSTGSVMFSILRSARDSGVFLVPMQSLGINTLRSMAKKEKNGSISFSSVDYHFKFPNQKAFDAWLNRRYQWTLQMSVAKRFGHVLYFAVVHAPVGGVVIGGRKYLGGQFIPTTSLESLHPEQRIQIEKASAAMRQRRSEAAAAHRQPNETWQEAIKRHVGEHANREISLADRQSMIRRLNAMRNHHGDQVAERITHLAGQEAAQLAGTSDSAKAEHLKRRLAAYHAMVGMLSEKDLPKPQQMAQAASEAKGPETGKPFEFTYAHNTEKSGKFGKQFGQHIEPHGRYLVDTEGAPPANTPGWEYGKHKFENPLVVDFGGDYRDDSNWKAQLSKKYGGKTGKELSQAIRDDGHDGIVTKDKHGTSEIVDLTSFKKKDEKQSIPLTSEQSINQLIDRQAKQAKNLMQSGMTVEQAIEKLKEESTLGPASWDKVRAQLPQDDTGHKSALSEMADAANDVDVTIKNRLHNEMKSRLMDQMKDYWPHLTEEQRAKHEAAIAKLPHTAMDEVADDGDNFYKAHPDAQAVASAVEDDALEAKQNAEEKAADEKRRSEHANDLKQAEERGMMFERPDNHKNPGELKVNPEKLDLAKKTAADLRAQAKQHLADSKNQLNKQLVSRSKRMHKHLNEAADDIERQIAAHEKKSTAPAKQENRASADALSEPAKPFDAAAIAGSGNAAPHHKEMLADLDREWHRHSVAGQSTDDGRVRWGGSDFDDTNKGRIGKAFADAIRAGKTPMEAHQIALEAGKKSVKQWNDVDSKGRASATGNYQLKQWEGSGSDYADSLMRRFHQVRPEVDDEGAKAFNNAIAPLRDQVGKLDDIAKKYGDRYAWESTLKNRNGDTHDASKGIDDWKGVAKEMGIDADGYISKHKEYNDLLGKLNAHRSWGDSNAIKKDAQLASKPNASAVEHDDEGNARLNITLPSGEKHSSGWVEKGGRDDAELYKKLAGKALASFNYKLNQESNGAKDSADFHSRTKGHNERKQSLVNAMYPIPETHSGILAKYDSASGNERQYRVEPRYNPDHPEGRQYQIVYDEYDPANNKMVSTGNTYGAPVDSLDNAMEELGRHKLSVRDGESNMRVLHQDAQKHYQKAAAEKKAVAENEERKRSAEYQKAEQERSANAKARVELGEMMKGKRKQGKMDITFPGGHKAEVKGVQVGNFLVHRPVTRDTETGEIENESGYNVTHIPSGKAAHRENGSQATALELAHLLSAHGDWSKKDIDNDVLAHGAQVAKHWRAGNLGAAMDAINKAKAQSPKGEPSVLPPAIVTSANKETDKVMAEPKQKKKGLLDSIVAENQKHAKIDSQASASQLRKEIESIREKMYQRSKNSGRGTAGAMNRDIQNLQTTLDAKRAQLKQLEQPDQNSISQAPTAANTVGVSAPAPEARNPADLAKKLADHYLKNFETGIHQDLPPGASEAIGDLDDEGKKQVIRRLVSAGMLGQPWLKRKKYSPRELLNDLHLNARMAESDHRMQKADPFGEKKSAKEHPWYKKAKETSMRFAIIHAPAGGADVDGHHYLGGQFTPNDDNRAAIVKPAVDYSQHPGTTAEAAMQFMSHEPTYAKVKNMYLTKNATFNPDGSIKSIPINTDDWREYIPGYIGTNAHVVHGAASSANDKMFREALEKMKGKGNKKVAILGGGGGCHGFGTPIMMADGSIKEVQNVREGDALMGPDSMPRVVQKLIRGRAKMYLVSPTKGDAFTVNGDHILSLHTITRNKVKKRRRDVKVEITVDNVLKRGKRFFDNFFLYRVPVEFDHSVVPLDPYFLGLWLGDGTTGAAAITNADGEIREYLSKYVEQFPGLKLRIAGKPDNKASIFHLSLVSQTKKGKQKFVKNPLVQMLRDIGVLDGKYIPDVYLRNSREVRLALLAGLIDSDGSYDNRGGFDFVTKHKHLADQVEYLARSLGFSAYAKACRKSSQEGAVGTYYRMFICGDIDLVPVKVLRKKAYPRATHYGDGRRTRDVLHTGFKIEPLDDGDYYGFTLSGDGLYLLGDFTVTHNSGKGTSVGKHFDQHDYPIRVDQVSGNYDHLVAKIKQIKDAGFDADIVFVDRSPHEAWQGVVGRAMMSHEKGDHPRTVPYHVAVQANIDARRVALRLAQENPDVNLRVIDNNGEGDSRLLEDRTEIIKHLLQSDKHNPDEEKRRAKEHVNKLEAIGQLPRHIAHGLRGGEEP